jgi:hypothetical protein
MSLGNGIGFTRTRRTGFTAALLAGFSLTALLFANNAVAIEAETGTVAGAARVVDKAHMSGGRGVGFLGNGAANFVTIPVSVTLAGSYTMTIHYTSGSVRNLFWSTNNGTAASATGLSSGNWTTVATHRTSVTLNAGANSIRFFNDTAYAPDLDQIVISGGPVAGTPAFCANYPPTNSGWISTKVFYGGTRLQYAVDSQQNRIPDYSYAGYRYGQNLIPTVPVVSTLGPVSGDNTSRIQSALNAVAARTPDANGIRGALLLSPGTYEIRGTLRVGASGVVLRGSGDGSTTTSNTILRATGNSPSKRDVVILGSNSSGWTEVTPRTNITNSLVQIGARSFTVASTSGFAVGNEVVVHHPSTSAWLNAVDGGGTSTEWAAGSVDIVYFRKITGISGITVTVDAPVFNHLNRSLSQSYLSRVTSTKITNAGVENLRIDIVTAGGDDENHAWNGLTVRGAHDSWVRGVTVLHFGYAGVRLENAVRVTVENSKALDPIAVRTGGNMYNFSADTGAQLVLFKNNQATNGRHSYITNGTSRASGNVFYRSSQQGGGSEGGHRRWATGMLYDNITGDGQVLLINRGDFGSGHGWAAAHSTIWVSTAEMVVQKPPTAQNYLVSNVGTLRSSAWFPGEWGSREFRSGEMNIPSLYEAQLCDRLEN